MNLLSTPGGTRLAWLDGTDDHIVLSEEGTRPDWTPEPGERVPVPDRVPLPTEGSAAPAEHH